MRQEISKLEIQNETDVVKARQRAKQIAMLMAFAPQDQTRIATAVSEIVRSVFEKSKKSAISFYLRERLPHRLFIDVVFKGIVEDTDFTGARKLMDFFERKTSSLETKLTVVKKFEENQFILTKVSLETLKAELSKLVPQDPLEDMRNQNQELLDTLNQLRENQEKLKILNLELENTNRGVLALYSELDEKAQALHKANQVKTRFLSNVTHEFRTPVNSIANVSRILLTDTEATLSLEQKQGIEMIAGSAKTLSEMVNDLLDLAKVEAGRISVRASEFSFSKMFGTLSALFKPLMAQHPLVLLHFVEPSENVYAFTDEGKLSQVLRNLISNALKFTEAGEVRVEVKASQKESLVTFLISDTGIGIPQRDLDYIFDEFVQIESELQQKNRGTGLGLPLARKLATVLGGNISVKSVEGKGSVFRVQLPLFYTGPSEANYVNLDSKAPGHRKLNILIIDDDFQDRYQLGQLLEKNMNCNLLFAQGGHEGLSIAKSSALDLVFLDIAMPEISGMEVLKQLRSDSRTSKLPVLFHSNLILRKDQFAQVNLQNTRFVSKMATHDEKLRIAFELLNFEFQKPTKEVKSAERSL